VYDPPLRLSASGVPYLGKNQMEHMAARFKADCKAFLKQDGPASFAREFAENYLRLKVDHQWLGPDGCNLGMSVFADGTDIPVYVPETNKARWLRVSANTVLLDRSLLEAGRKNTLRFTLMHESAHHLLHGNYYRRAAAAGKGVTAPFRREAAENADVQPREAWGDTDWMEWQANYMASALLAPKPEIEAWLRDEDVYGYYAYRVERGISRNRAMSQVLSSFARRFGVSAQMAEIRLRGLGFDPGRECYALAAL